jgi:DNA-binding XRE family transcriptional regulator
MNIEIDTNIEANENTTMPELAAKLRGYCQTDMLPLAGATKACRSVTGLSQKDFADVIGLTRAALSRIESNKVERPAFKTLQSLKAVAELMDLPWCVVMFEGYILKENRKSKT